MVQNKIRRRAAFAALARALTRGSRGGPSLGARIGALPRMLLATARGRYDGGLRVALMVAAGAYIASPVDLVPEAFLSLLGLADDAVMVAWLAGAVLAETERFLAWEGRRAATIPGHVVS